MKHALALIGLAGLLACGCRTVNTTVYMCPNAIDSEQSSAVPIAADLDKKVDAVNDAQVSPTLPMMK